MKHLAYMLLLFLLASCANETDERSDVKHTTADKNSESSETPGPDDDSNKDVSDTDSSESFTLIAKGDEGGSCKANGTCNGDLKCESNICVTPLPGWIGDTCSDSKPCNSLLTCNASNICVGTSGEGTACSSSTSCPNNLICSGMSGGKGMCRKMATWNLVDNSEDHCEIKAKIYIPKKTSYSNLGGTYAALENMLELSGHLPLNEFVNEELATGEYDSNSQAIMKKRCVDDPDFSLGYVCDFHGYSAKAYVSAPGKSDYIRFKNVGSSGCARSGPCLFKGRESIVSSQPSLGSPSDPSKQTGLGLKLKDIQRQLTNILEMPIVLESDSSIAREYLAPETGWHQSEELNAFKKYVPFDRLRAKTLRELVPPPAVPECKDTLRIFVTESQYRKGLGVHVATSETPDRGRTYDFALSWDGIIVEKVINLTIKTIGSGSVTLSGSSPTPLEGKSCSVATGETSCKKYEFTADHGYYVNYTYTLTATPGILNGIVEVNGSACSEPVVDAEKTTCKIEDFNPEVGDRTITVTFKPAAKEKVTLTPTRPNPKVKGVYIMAGSDMCTANPNGPCNVLSFDKDSEVDVSSPKTNLPGDMTFLRYEIKSGNLVKIVGRNNVDMTKPTTKYKLKMDSDKTISVVYAADTNMSASPKAAGPLSIGLSKMVSCGPDCYTIEDHVTGQVSAPTTNPNYEFVGFRVKRFGNSNPELLPKEQTTYTIGNDDKAEESIEAVYVEKPKAKLALKVTGPLRLQPSVGGTALGAGCGSTTNAPGNVVTCPASSLTAVAVGSQIKISVTKPDGNTATIKWGDVCSHTSNNATDCYFTPTEGKEYTASAALAKTYTLSISRPSSGTINGTVQSAGSPSVKSFLSCVSGSGACIEKIEENSTVSLAINGLESKKVTWFGCEGEDLICKDFTMTSDRSITVNIEPLFKLTATLLSGGTVAATLLSGKAGSACGPGCNEYTAGSKVRLSVTPNVLGAKAQWTGCSSISLTCDVNITAPDLKVEISFPPKKLTVTKAGTGKGTISATSTTSSLSCDENCSTKNAFLPQGDVQLKAVAATGHKFKEWSGPGAAACPTKTAPDCTILLTDETSVTGTFESIVPTYKVTFLKQPASSTASVGFSGGTACAESAGQTIPNCRVFPKGTNVVLTPNEVNGWRFAGWESDTSLPSPSPKTVTIPNLSADTTVTANFVQAFNLTAKKDGPGTLVVSPSQSSIDICGADCKTYPAATTVSLTAVSGTNSTFVGWNNADCPAVVTPNLDSYTCTLTMNANKSVRATFKPKYKLTVIVTGGSGSVSGQVTSCGKTSPYCYEAGSTAALTATIPAGWKVTWSEAGCAENATSCNVSIGAADKVVTAAFTKITALKCAIAPEHSLASLTCEGGLRVAIKAISWGTPLTGGADCFDESNVSCKMPNAAAATDVVKTYCTGQSASACSVPAENSTFSSLIPADPATGKVAGDPCNGTYKTLAVSYRCE